MRKTVAMYCQEHELDWILHQWDTEKNELTPHEVSYGSKRHIWWKCKAGHSWQSNVGAKLKFRYYCPYCNGQRIISGVNDFATLYPEAFQQWIPEKNTEVPHPSIVKTRDTTKVWWRCAAHHEWQASYASRANGRGCPVCAGKVLQAGINDLITNKPLTAKSYSAHNTVHISEVFAHDTRMLWWDCIQCSASFTSPAHRWTTYVSCDNCSTQRSTGEVSLGRHIEQFIASVDNITKTPIEYNARCTVDDRIYEMDIYLPERGIAFEYNGDYWHSNAALYAATGEYAFPRHQRKRDALHDQGITLYTVWEYDWTYHQTLVEHAIMSVLQGKAAPQILHKLESVIDNPALYEDTTLEPQP